VEFVEGPGWAFYLGSENAGEELERFFAPEVFKGSSFRSAGIGQVGNDQIRTLSFDCIKDSLGGRRRNERPFFFGRVCKNRRDAADAEQDGKYRSATSMACCHSPE